MATIKENLNVILRSINTRGWRQGSYGLDGGPCCLAGHCIIAITNSMERRELSDFLFDGLKQNPVFWNDKPGRTVEEVIAKVKELANGFS